MAIDKAEIDRLRKEAIEKELAFGVSRLRTELRMKPSVDAKPHKWVKSPYNRAKNPIYLVADCVPLRTRKSVEPTKKVLLARKISGLKAKLRSPSNQAIERLTVLLQQPERVVYLDSETTGLEKQDQIIELGIIDIHGRVLYDKRFKPSVAINEDAQDVHGISADSLSSQPEWPSQVDSIAEILRDKTVIIFNKEFDIRLLEQTSKAFNLDTEWVRGLPTYCAMALAATVFGSTNRYGTISLATSAVESGLAWAAEAHNAVNDCEMTRQVIMKILERYNAIKIQIASLEAAKAAL